MRLSTLSLVQELHSSSPPPPWRFDLLSALIGAAIAFLLIGLFYALRDTLSHAWEVLLATWRRLVHYLLADAEEVYREQVIARARSLVVLPQVVSLDAVFVEPELRLPPPAPYSISEIQAQPEPRTRPLHQILEGYSRLIILGGPATGKTSVLAYLALMCARTEQGEAVPQAVRGRLPLYILLPTLDWDEPAANKNGGGVAKLIGAAIGTVGRGSGFAALLRKYLESGQAIVLADGWDELRPSQRQQAIVWLSELVEALPGNLWLVAGGLRDYAPLIEANFVPLALAEWRIKQAEALAQRWLDVCTPEGEPPSVSFHELTASLRRAVRLGYSPLELSLLAFVYLTDRQPPTGGRVALFDRALEVLLQRRQKRKQEEDPTLLVAYRRALGQVALTLQQEKRVAVSQGEIEASIEEALPPPEERPIHATARVFRMLTSECGLFRQIGRDRYILVHSLWRAYLAARQLVAMPPAMLVERLDDPCWANVLRFYAELGDMGPLVVTWLRAPDDIFYTRLHTLGAWVGAALPDAAWRDGAMAVLAGALLRPGHFALTRRTLAEALATSGVSGVTYFLKQALQHSDADVRSAALMGLARVADEADLPAFEAALRDEVPTVREAAIRALTSLAGDAAIRWLEQALLEGDDVLRLTAAETLAKCGDEGVAFLREMVESKYAAIRRVGVIGLGLAGVRDGLERVAQNDEQWSVRSAAAAALEELEKRTEATGVTPPPRVEQLPWLITWAANRGEGVGLGEAARLMLRRALSEGDERVRLAAAQTLAQVGRPDDVDSLRAALSDPNRDVANAAFEALAEISRRYDLKIGAR